MAAGNSAAIVSICFAKGRMPIALRVFRMSFSSPPVRSAICRSEKPDFLACSIVVAGRVAGVNSLRILFMSEILRSLYRNHGSILVSDWMRSTL